MAPTILAIDDDPIVLHLHKMMLQMHGYRVLAAASGLEALTILAGNAIDCVVLDFHMPKMDGAAVTAEIKRRHSSIPVIIVSGSAVEGQIVGADGYVDKIAAFRELPKKIEALLGKRAVAGPKDSGRRRAS